MDDNRCCRFPYSFHPWLRVRSHPLPTFPLLRLDLVASVYTLCSDLDIDHAADAATGIKNALWHRAPGSVQRLAGKSGERLLQWGVSGDVRTSRGATGPPRALACAEFSVPAAARRAEAFRGLCTRAPSSEHGPRRRAAGSVLGASPLWLSSG